MKIRYIRDFRSGQCQLVGTLVMSGEGEDTNVGLAMCRGNDNFNKKMGVKIANGRAKIHNGKVLNGIIPNRTIYTSNGVKVKLIDEVIRLVESMEGAKEPVCMM